MSEREPKGLKDWLEMVLEKLTALHQRTVRVETRLSKLMMHVGLKPDGSINSQEQK